MQAIQFCEFKPAMASCFYLIFAVKPAARRVCVPAPNHQPVVEARHAALAGLCWLAERPGHFKLETTL
jgi:hypothetical protein